MMRIMGVEVDHKGDEVEADDRGDKIKAGEGVDGADLDERLTG